MKDIFSCCMSCKEFELIHHNRSNAFDYCTPDCSKSLSLTISWVTSHYASSHCLIALWMLQYHSIMYVLYVYNVSRLILHSHRASFTSQLFLFVSPRLENPQTILSPWERPWKIHGNWMGCRTPNSLENVHATFSWLIILKCSGWLTMSTLNYAHYTS